MEQTPATLLRRVRELSGLSQSEVGQLVGLPQSTVSIVENADDHANRLSAAILRAAANRVELHRVVNGDAVTQAARDGADAAAVLQEHLPDVLTPNN